MATPVSDIKAIFEAHPPLPSRPGDYVAYLDETDPNAGVGLFHADGSLSVGMTTAAYDAFCAHPAVLREASK